MICRASIASECQRQRELDLPRRGSQTGDRCRKAVMGGGNITARPGPSDGKFRLRSHTANTSPFMAMARSRLATLASHSLFTQTYAAASSSPDFLAASARTLIQSSAGHVAHRVGAPSRLYQSGLDALTIGHHDPADYSSNMWPSLTDRGPFCLPNNWTVILDPRRA